MRCLWLSPFDMRFWNLSSIDWSLLHGLSTLKAGIRIAGIGAMIQVKSRPRHDGIDGGFASTLGIVDNNQCALM